MGSIIQTNVSTGAKYRTYTSDYSYGNINGLNNISGAIELFYRVDTATTSWRDLFGLNYTKLDSMTNDSLRIEEGIDNGSMQFVVHGQSTSQLYTPDIYTNGQLVHIVLNYERTSTNSTQIDLYVDNRFIGPAYISSTVLYDFLPGTMLTVGAQDPTTRPLSKGDIYTVRLYNTSLSKDQIAINYDRGKWMDANGGIVDLSKYNFNVSKQNTLNQNISLELDRPSVDPVSVNYLVSDGTACAPYNYSLENNSVTFLPGETKKQIKIMLPDNHKLEKYPMKYFTVSLSNPSGIRLGEISSSTVSIGNNGGLAFSFDDHDYENWRDYVLPLLIKYNANATFFVSTYVSPNALLPVLRSLQNNGSEIGIHTTDHIMASEYIANHTVDDYLQTQCYAEETQMQNDGLDIPTALAIPYGDTGSDALRSALPKNYINVRGTVDAYGFTNGLYKKTDKIYYHFDNTQLTYGGTVDQDTLNTKLVCDAIDRAMENGEVVQVLSHRSTPTKVSSGITVENFENILRYANESGATFYTHTKMYNPSEIYPNLMDFNATNQNGTVPYLVRFTPFCRYNHEFDYIFCWDFENNGTIDSTNQNTVNTYTKTGNYTVNLTILSEFGNFSTVKTNYITVTNPSFASDPVAWFNFVYAYLHSVYLTGMIAA